MLKDEEIRKLLEKAIFLKSNKEPDWHVPITKAIRKELDSRLSYWVDLCKPQNLMPVETTDLINKMKECILENSLNHLNQLIDENNNHRE